MKFRYNWIYSVANFIYYKIDYRISCLTVLVITALVISSLSLSCKQDNADSYYKRGVINADKGDWEAALNNLNKAIELNPNLSEAYLSRGMVKSKMPYFMYPKPENVTDGLTYAFQDTMQDFNKAIELNPNLAKAYSARGGQKSGRNDHRGALQDYSKAIELEPSLIGELVSEGMSFTIGANHEYTVALKYYNKAIELNPNWADAYYNRGLAYYELGAYIGAILDYNKAIELNPNDYRSYNNRGDAKSEQGDNIGAMQDYNKAIELKYSRAIELNPNDYRSYVNRGIDKFELGYRGAILDYNKAIELDPNNAEAYKMRGLAKSVHGDNSGAMQDSLKAFSKRVLCSNRGNTKSELVSYKEAIQDFNKAIEINPNYANAYYNRGIAKIQLGQKDSGCLDLSKAGEMGNSKAYDAIKQVCQ